MYCNLIFLLINEYVCVFGLYICIRSVERPNRILRLGKIMERTIPENWMLVLNFNRLSGWQSKHDSRIRRKPPARNSVQRWTWLTSRPTDGRLTAFLIDDRYWTLRRHAYPTNTSSRRPSRASTIPRAQERECQPSPSSFAVNASTHSQNRASTIISLHRSNNTLFSSREFASKSRESR